MRIVIGTANRDKFREIERILRPADLGVELLFGGELSSQKPDETGKTFYENALIKAKFYSQLSGLPAVADDSGLVVYALDGAPGVFSSRYAGEGCTYEDNNRKLLRELIGVPAEQRGAKFVCTAVLYVPEDGDFVATGVLEGRIADAPRGVGGFGYDPVFQLPDGRTVAELSPEEKNRISHRAKAFSQMREIIKSILI